MYTYLSRELEKQIIFSLSLWPFVSSFDKIGLTIRLQK